MNKQMVTIVIDFQIYAYLFKPIINKLIERDVEVIIYCSSVIKDLVIRELAVSPNVFVEDLDEIKRQHKYRWRLHRVLQALFTRNDYSFQYDKIRNKSIEEMKAIQWLLHKISQFIPKVPNRKINIFLHKISGMFLDNPFPTNKILVGSLSSCAELLCANGQQVHTIMESWDHSVKIPNGYVSYCVYAWNQSLAEDWKNYQHDSNCIPIYPLKLRFAIQEVLGKGLWTKSRGQRLRPMCVYAVASTQRSKNLRLRSLDERIISDLIIATREANWDFFIKPRPNGQEGEFDKFLKGNKHVRIGCYLDNYDKNFANYFLDDEYNMRRFQEIIEADVVINAFTTFGLDAAVAGMPVLQLDLREAISYEDSSRYFGNHHIEKYLLEKPYTFKVIGEDFLNPISEYLKAPTGLAEHFSENLRKWLIPEISMDRAIDKLLDNVLCELSCTSNND